MAYENAKATLKEVQRQWTAYNVLYLRAERLEAEIGASGLNYDGMPHSGTPSSPTEAIAIMLADTKAELNKTWAAYMEARNKAVGIINRIDDYKQSAVLKYRYIDGLKWEDIAMLLTPEEKAAQYEYMTVRHVHRIHAAALCEVQMILGGFEK